MTGLGALWVAAVVIIVVAFAVERGRRARAFCEEFGHNWSEHYTGYECERCGRRA